MSPTLYQVDLRITNHRRQKSPPSFTLHSFKTRIKWPLGWPQPQVFRGYFLNFCNFPGNVEAFRLTELLRWQKLTSFFQHFLQDCRFRSLQFCFRRKFLFSEKRTLESGLTVACFFSTNHYSLLRIAINEIASFCINHRSSQMAFFRAKGGGGGGGQRRGKRPAFALCWNILK